MGKEITKEKILEMWDKIIATTQNRDPNYSFRLFDEIYRGGK